MSVLTRREALACGIAAAPGLCFGAETPTEKLPPRKEILALLRRVNEWQTAHPVMPPDDRTWERGTWYTGIMAVWKATGDRKFLEQALAWGRHHEWQPGTEAAGANRLFPIQTWIEAYFATKDRVMIEPAIRWLETPSPYSPAGAKRWYLAQGRSYDDSLYGASALAMLFKATGNRKYLQIMDAFFDDVTAELFDKEEDLYYRDNRFIGRKTANGKKVLWSRGNGWVFAGIARILEYLPKNEAARPRYVKMFRTMAASLIKRQGEDGLWPANLDDAEEVPGPETSGSGFFCFGLAWGVNHGVLERARYLPAAKKAWAGLSRAVNTEGKVRWGQQVADRPFATAEESTHEYVTGTFLLAGSEMYKLAGAR